MTSKKFRAPLTVVLLAAAPLALLALPAYAAGPKLTKAVNNALADEQKAYTAGDFKTAADDIAKARTVDGRTPEDDYWINKIDINVQIKTNNMAGADQDAEAAADSPAMPPEDKTEMLRLALILANNQKHTDKAVTYAKALQATNPTDAGVISQITVAYFNAKDFPAAQVVVQKQIDVATAAGKTPARDTLQNLLDVQVAQKDEAGAEKTLEQLVAGYNDPKDWTQMIDVTITSKGIRDTDIIWLGRLLFQVGATASAEDSNLFGQTASHATFFGDALVSQQHGGTGFPDPTARADADKKTMPQQIAAGEKQNGNYNAKLAEALYSYGMYAEAEAAAKLAMSKGGTTDPSEAPMVLGQSLVAQGKYADAVTAFGQVQGGGPATARITRLWVDYAKVKQNPPAATAAAAPAK
ncbi:MAG TPA: hypothetical protein VH019_07795 [Rhizomicrobium sp.]|jgi:tetratricopeptide (TPR) repeat protein|nr:hypothetical protein [Rhizomicrobium sp.]